MGAAEKQSDHCQIKTQVGAFVTIPNQRTVYLNGEYIPENEATLPFRDRGVKVLRTSQLNVGGNTDFYNMLERRRLESKKISKTNAVTSQLDYDLGEDNIHIGPKVHF